VNGGKQHERDDPFELVAVPFPTTSDQRADEELTRCLVEEFALAGFTARQVAALFESPEYAATHGVLRRRGPQFVRAIIAAVYGGGT
jgi:hypothetical protein